MSDKKRETTGETSVPTVVGELENFPGETLKAVKSLGSWYGYKYIILLWPKAFTHINKATKPSGETFNGISLQEFAPAEQILHYVFCFKETKEAVSYRICEFPVNKEHLPTEEVKRTLSREGVPPGQGPPASSLFLLEETQTHHISPAQGPIEVDSYVYSNMMVGWPLAKAYAMAVGIAIAQWKKGIPFQYAIIRSVLHPEKGKNHGDESTHMTMFYGATRPDHLGDAFETAPAHIYTTALFDKVDDKIKLVVDSWSYGYIKWYPQAATPEKAAEVLKSPAEDKRERKRKEEKGKVKADEARVAEIDWLYGNDDMDILT
ncbi:MAG: hypothetical protein M1824_001768 [Vezdaea acicularis]|nr:MAG: hypothetical protein M1824_001768 [Vezdaea acicularis]